jgi:predicted nucleotidyltransferase
MSRGAKIGTDISTPTWEQLRPEVTDELLAQMTRRIVEAFHPHKVILFGSYACGTPHRDSDVDLLVIMDSEDTMTRRMIEVKRKAKVAFLPMDILVYTPQEVEARLAMGDFFIREILDRGKVLYCCDVCR